MPVTSNGTVTQVAEGVYDITNLGYSGEAFADLYIDYTQGGEHKVDIELYVTYNGKEYPYAFKHYYPYQASIRHVRGADIPITCSDVKFRVIFRKIKYKLNGPDPSLPEGTFEMLVEFHN